MPRFEKWLTGVDPKAAIDTIARQALPLRLRAVSHFLEQATHSDDEAEAVHQLRIWTRRAGTAIDFFQPAIARAERQWMKKTLRKVRRAAGGIRDCDVHWQRLTADNRPVPRHIKRELSKNRRSARQKLKRLYRRLGATDHFQTRAENLVASIRWPKRHSSRTPPPFANWCRAQLLPLAARFFERVDAGLSDLDQIHELRITGKKFRYALELAPAMTNARTHRSLSERLNEIQDRLGEICDARAAVDQLRAWRKRSSKPRIRKKLKKLLRHEQQQLAGLHARLLQWWSPARRQRLLRLWQRAADQAR